jgi:hypothetical protein
MGFDQRLRVVADGFVPFDEPHVASLPFALIPEDGSSFGPPVLITVPTSRISRDEENERERRPG